MAEKTPATQSFVPLADIRDGVAVLKDGGLRAILMVSSINFTLKSVDEQEAILAQFQAFLNTLDFSLQIYVQSRRLDINPYLAILASKEVEQANDLMRVQLREYIEFIRTFTTETDIMVKSFFVVVPYSPVSLDLRKGVNAFLSGERRTSTFIADDVGHFEEYRMQLEQRIAVVEQGLARVGLRSVPLGADEVVELFYHLFNPHEGGKAPEQRG